MVTFSGTNLVVDDITEQDIGTYLPGLRARSCARGRDGKFYAIYGAVNAAGTTAIVRCICFSVSPQGAVTVNWDFKVCDSALGYTGEDDPGGVDVHNAALAMDWNGTVERVLVLAVATTLGNAGLFYTNVASPATFTAGDTFTIKDEAALAWGGFELFGRKDGADSIHVVYMNGTATSSGSDAGTSIAVLKHRTCATHSSSWSAATNILAAELFSGYWTAAFARTTNGDLYVTLGVTVLGSRRLLLFKYNGSWSTVATLATYSAVVGEDYNPVSMCADLSGNLHLALLDFVDAGAGITHVLRYMKMTTAGSITENVVLQSVGYANTAIASPVNYSLRYWRSAAITVDSANAPTIVAGLRANPVGFTPCEKHDNLGNSNLYGICIVFRKVTGSWLSYTPDVQQSVNPPPVNTRTVNTIQVPHDCCEAGKLGVPARGVLWLHLACASSSMVGTNVICNGGIFRRVFMSSDFEAGLTRSVGNSANGSQLASAPLHKKLLTGNTASGSHGAISNKTLSRSVSNTANGASACTGGKAKAAASTGSGSQAASATIDYLSKWKTSNTAGGSQAATLNKVIIRACGNTAGGSGGIGKAIDAGNTAGGSQFADHHGTIRVSASSSAGGSQTVISDPIETCETNYVPTPAIPADPESVQFITITAPFASPVDTLTFRRPDHGNIDVRMLQGEVARGRDGTLQITKRTPLPQRWSVTFSGLTRKQTIEFETFLETWAANEMIYRDANNRRWRAYCLTSPVSFLSAGPENWSVTLEFQGSLLS